MQMLNLEELFTYNRIDGSTDKAILHHFPMMCVFNSFQMERKVWKAVFVTIKEVGIFHPPCYHVQYHARTMQPKLMTNRFFS